MTATVIFYDVATQFTFWFELKSKYSFITFLESTYWTHFFPNIAFVIECVVEIDTVSRLEITGV